MPKPNSKCKVCGKEYYLCPDGYRRAKWARITCSPACFEIWENKRLGIEPEKVEKPAEEVVEEVVKTTSKRKKTTE